MADPTYKTADITTEIERLARANQLALGLKFIRYGDDELIPDVPALIIEPGRKSRNWFGTTAQTANEFEVVMFVYHTGFEENSEVQKECDRITEGWEDTLNTNAAPAAYGGTKLNGRIIQGIVTTIEYGYSRKGDTKMRANRLVFSCSSRTRLVNS